MSKKETQLHSKIEIEIRQIKVCEVGEKQSERLIYRGNNRIKNTI